MTLLLPRGGWGQTKPPVGTKIDTGSPLAAGLVGAWTFAEAGGRLAIDQAGGPTGYLTTSAAWAPGRLSIPGGGAHVALPATTRYDLGSKDLTVVYRFQTTQTSSEVWFGGYNTSGFAGYGFGHNVTAAGTLDLWNGSAWVGVSGMGLTDGVWHTAALTLRNTDLRGYRDGILRGTATSSRPSSYTGAKAIGKVSDGTGAWTGQLAFVYLYTRALTPTEIAALYTDPYQMFTPPVWRRYFIPAGGGGAATSDPASIRSVAGLSTVAAKASFTTVSMRAVGRVAAPAVKAATATSALSAPARIAATGIKGGIEVPSERATGRLAATGVHAGTTTSTVRAPARLALVVTSARTATVALRGAAGLLASSAPTYVQPAMLCGMARISVVTVRGSTTTAQLSGSGRMAVTGVTARTAQTVTTVTGRMAVTAVRTGAATVTLRGSGVLRMTASGARTASVALRARGFGTSAFGVVIVPTRAAAADSAYGGAVGSDAAHTGAGAGDLALVGAAASDSEV